ncbi:MAG TPA: tetratricopeptide repeat protein [Anaeromyxobacteraceae bacterium]|jgi:predicted Zn finger-like uncharacterized protein|nr:tetratricopeptide repeat protein [Anaeromyxobacteraceae bacterium]
MHVRCERCKTDYDLEPSRVTEAGVAVRCRCGHVFRVKRKAQPSSPPAPADFFKPPGPSAPATSRPGAEPPAPAEEQPYWERPEPEAPAAPPDDVAHAVRGERPAVRFPPPPPPRPSGVEVVRPLAPLAPPPPPLSSGSGLTAVVERDPRWAQPGLAEPAPAPGQAAGGLSRAPAGHPGAPLDAETLSAFSRALGSATDDEPRAVPAPVASAVDTAADSLARRLGVASAPRSLREVLEAERAGRIEEPEPATSSTAGDAAMERPERPRRSLGWPVAAVLALVAGGLAGYVLVQRAASPAIKVTRRAAVAQSPARADGASRASSSEPTAKALPADAAAPAAPTTSSPPAPQPAAAAPRPASPTRPATAPPVQLASAPAAQPYPRPRSSVAPSSGDASLASLLVEARRARSHGKFKRALDLFGKAIAQDSSRVEALSGRGWCYLELSRYEPAGASFRAALAHEPEDGEALMGLAETYRYEGRKEDAVRYYQRYLAAHPQGDEATTARNAIQALEE